MRCICVERCPSVQWIGCCVNSEMAWTLWRSVRPITDGRTPNNECWVFSAHSPVTVPTALHGSPYSTTCFLNNCSFVLFPKLPDFRRTFAQRLTDDKNPRNFSCHRSEQFGWKMCRNLWFVCFKDILGSKLEQDINEVILWIQHLNTKSLSVSDILTRHSIFKLRIHICTLLIK